MATIPDEVLDQLEYDENRKVQHKDIVEVMWGHDRRRVSVYQLQQALDVEVSKTTLRKRLRELVILDVVNRHEYDHENFDTFELECRKLVADGGHLRHGKVKEMVTLQDIPALDNISFGAMYTGMAFFVISIAEVFLGVRPGAEAGEPIKIHIGRDTIVESNSQFMEAGLIVFLFGTVIAIVILGVEKYNQHIKPKWGKIYE